MSTSSDKSDKSPTPPEKSTVILLLNDMGSVTWRMFIPIIGFAFVGNYADEQFATGPWIMLAAAGVGAFISGILIKKQLQKVDTK